MTGLDVGGQALRALQAGRTGCVLASSTKAVYLALAGSSPRDIVAIVDPQAPPGPLHLRARPPDVVVNQPVSVSAGVLDVGSHRLAIPHDVWAPALVPDVGKNRLRAAVVIRAVLRHEPHLGAHDGDYLARLARGDLAGALQWLAGRGPGLTPAGDDVAAGLLLALRARDDVVSREQLAALALAHQTHEIAAAFVRAAAQGECIEPAHALLAAAARDDEKAVGTARDQLACIGHTSGLDLAWGVALGLIYEASTAVSAGGGTVRLV